MTNRFAALQRGVLIYTTYSNLNWFAFCMFRSSGIPVRCVSCQHRRSSKAFGLYRWLVLPGDSLWRATFSYGRTASREVNGPLLSLSCISSITSLFRLPVANAFGNSYPLAILLHFLSSASRHCRFQITWFIPLHERFLNHGAVEGGASCWNSPTTEVKKRLHVGSPPTCAKRGTAPRVSFRLEGLDVSRDNEISTTTGKSLHEE